MGTVSSELVIYSEHVLFFKKCVWSAFVCAQVLLVWA